MVALTGGIGSGKSAVGGLFAERGAFVVDADGLARDAVAPGTEGLARVRERFGAEVIGEHGELNRAAAAARVFDDEQARLDLEAIVHPIVDELARQRFAATRTQTANTQRLLVYEIPLLAEGLEKAPDAEPTALRGQPRPTPFAAVVVVDCSDETRLSRLIARGLDPDDARRRIEAQASRDERLAIADFVITNDGSLDELRKQVDQLWSPLCDFVRRAVSHGG